MYQDYLLNNPPKHPLVDRLYPFVCMQKGAEPDAKYGIMYNNKIYEIADSFCGTLEAAVVIKCNVLPQHYTEALQERAATYAEERDAMCRLNAGEATQVSSAGALAGQNTAPDAPDTSCLAVPCKESPQADRQEVIMRQAYDKLHEYVEAGCFLEEQVADRMLKLSVHDNGMFLKDFRDDRFIFEIYPSMNTAGTVAQIMWRLFPNKYECSFADWRGVVGAWMMQRGESVMNWQSLAFDTWQSAAYHKVKSWEDLCTLLNAVTSKD